MDSFGVFQRILYFGLLIGITVFFFWIVWGFMLPVFWAAVLAILSHPLYTFFLSRLKHRSLAALGTILCILILVFAPVYFLGSQLGAEATSLYMHLSEHGTEYLAYLENAPVIAPLLHEAGFDASRAAELLLSFARDASSWIASQALSIGIATFHTLLELGLTFYVLFFFLRDGEKLVAYLHRMLPLGDERERKLFSSFATSVYAICKGTLLVALVQGAAAWAIYAIAGLSGALLWGSLTALASLVPSIGSAAIWLPAGIILIASGSLWQGIVVLGGGLFVVSMIDNLLRPYLIGRGTRVPEALTLLSIFGGVSAFGFAGFVLGPVIAALFLSVLNLFATEYGEDLARRG